MKTYLLSVCYPAGSTQPPPDALQKIMHDVGALQKEMQNAGVWVFSEAQLEEADQLLKKLEGKEEEGLSYGW